MVASADDIEVTLADVRRFLRRSLLFRDDETPPNQPSETSPELARWIPAKQLASSSLQIHTVRSLLELELIRRQARRRGLVPERSAVLDSLSQHDRLAKFAHLFDDGSAEGAALPGPVTRADVLAVVRRQLLRERLQRALAESVSNDELWEIYRRRHDTAELAYVRRPNSPTAGTIQAFIHRNRRSQKSEIARYFARHDEEFTADELTRPIRRQIAAQLLRRSIVPSIRQTLTPALETLAASDDQPDGTLASDDLRRLERRLDERGFELETTETFARADRGSVPSLGLVRPVFEAAFDLTADDPVADDLILARGDVYAVRLLDRDRPDRSEFRSERQSFREEFLSKNSGRMFRAQLSHRLEKLGSSMNLKPLQIVYGRLKKSSSPPADQRTSEVNSPRPGGGSDQSTAE